MALTLAGLEIEKTSGYWRSKGFKKASIQDRLEREDGYIIHQRKEWRMVDLRLVSSQRRLRHSGVY